MRFLPAVTRTLSAKPAGGWSLETERFGTTHAEVGRLLGLAGTQQVEVVVFALIDDGRALCSDHPGAGRDFVLTFGATRGPWMASIAAVRIGPAQ